MSAVIVAPLIGTPSIWTLLIILAIALLLFGGTRLAGLGKSTGRAIKEFKEETEGLNSGSSRPVAGAPRVPGIQDPDKDGDAVADAEVVDPPRKTDR